MPIVGCCGGFNAFHAIVVKTIESVLGDAFPWVIPFQCVRTPTQGGYRPLLITLAPMVTHGYPSTGSHCHGHHGVVTAAQPLH